MSLVFSNVGVRTKFQWLLKRRDIFLHDGRSLRRISIGPRVQLGTLAAAALILAWSVFAAAQLAAQPVATTSTDIARMQSEVRAMRADVAAIKEAAEQRYDLTEAEIRELGLDPKRFQGQGGPFEAIEPLKSAADSKFKQLFTAWKKLDQIELGTIAIPSTQPVKGTALTSGYGVRSDPFRGRAAMHAGIDLAAPMGTNIYATADGYVQRSEWVNGYGNLVEVSHGRGIQTRYGHLSKSLVKQGEHVKRGQLIALMGSTGRSTGSHLHYEVRVDGKAVNPIPFMQSNDYLLAVQRRAASATKMAMGGPQEAAR